jgi:hypothetical protein
MADRMKNFDRLSKNQLTRANALDKLLDGKFNGREGVAMSWREANRTPGAAICRAGPDGGN